MARLAHRTRSLFAVIASCAGSAAAQPLDGEPPRIENIHVEYAAPAGCPDFDTFMGWVRERAPSARLAPESEDVRLFSVSFELRSDAAIGRVAVREPAKTTETREVTAVTCDETASALALIVAVAVDPSSMTRAVTAQEASKTETPGTGAPLPAFAPAPQPSQESVGPEPSDSGVPPQGAEPSDRWRWLLAVSAEATGGPAPALTPALRLAAAVRLSGDVAPTLRLSAARSVDRTVQAEDGRQAELAWKAARLEGCVAFPFPLLEIEPCAGAEGGILHGEGTSGVSDPKDEDRPWWAAIAGGRMRLLPAEHLTVELGAGALVPLRRDEFFLQPNTPVHRPPLVAAFFGLGVGVRLK